MCLWGNLAVIWGAVQKIVHFFTLHLKSQLNHPRNTRNHHHTSTLSRINYLIAFQHILGNNLNFFMYSFIWRSHSFRLSRQARTQNSNHPSSYWNTHVHSSIKIHKPFPGTQAAVNLALIQTFLLLKCKSLGWVFIKTIAASLPRKGSVAFHGKGSSGHIIQCPLFSYH